MYGPTSTASAATESTNLEASFLAQKQAALSSGDLKTASTIQRQLAVIRTDNRLAYATVSGYAPELLGTLPPPSYSVPPRAGSVPFSATMGWSPLLDQLIADRKEEGTATVQFTAGDPAFKGIGDQCKAAIASVDEKLKAAKPGSDDAKYLSDLKSLLMQGESNPAVAIQQSRSLTGYELSSVLKQLGAPLK